VADVVAPGYGGQGLAFALPGRRIFPLIAS